MSEEITQEEVDEATQKVTVYGGQTADVPHPLLLSPLGLQVRIFLTLLPHQLIKMCR